MYVFRPELDNKEACLLKKNKNNIEEFPDKRLMTNQQRNIISMEPSDHFLGKKTCNFRI